MSNAVFKRLTLKSLNKYFKTCKGFEKTLEKVVILRLGEGKCIAKLKIEEDHINPFGTLHGGMSSTLVDSISTYGLMSHSNVGLLVTVSVEMNIRFLKGANKGEEILIESKTMKIGKTLAFCDVEIKSKAKNKILVKGSHTKFIMRPN